MEFLWKKSVFYLLAISDETDHKEIHIYDTVYQKARSLISLHKILLFECRVSRFRSHSGHRSILVANQVLHENAIEKYLDKSLHLYLSSSINRHGYFDEIKRILQKYSGEHPVFLHYRDDEGIKVAKAHNSLYVNSGNENMIADLYKVLMNEKHIAWRQGKNISFPAWTTR